VLPVPDALTSRQRRELKASAQRLKSTFKIGKHGLSAPFVQSLDEALKHRELIKVKFDEFKDQKNTLAPVLAQKTRSELLVVVGNVAVLFRRKPEKPN
jgi:RNA-binding protein